MEYATVTAKAALLLCVCMAATVCGKVQETVVNIQLNSSSLAQDKVLYTFQTQSGYQILHGKNCPQDTIDIGRLDSQSVVLQRTVSFGDTNAYRPFCANPSAGALAIEAYNCSIAINGQLGILLMINIVPTFFVTGIMFPATFYTGSVVEGRENATVNIDSHSELLAQTQPTPGLFLPQYRIIGNGTAVFSVHQQRAGCLSLPVIKTVGNLDREVQSYWELTLEAYAEHAPTTLATSTTIGITVLDVNNKAPTIITSSGQSRVQASGSTLPGTSLTQFRAIDRDVGINGAILFTSVNVSSYLSVHPLSGAVFLYRSVHQQSVTNLSVLLVAEDRGGPTMFSTPQAVEVFINRVDMTSPQLLIHGLSQPGVQLYEVPEMTPVGHQVTTVELRGGDTSSLMLELENIGPCECFNLSSPVQGPNGTLFHILVARELTFAETLNGKYLLQLTLKDGHMSVESLSLEVLVADENEAPSFPTNMYNFSVSEGVSIGTVIGRVFATDPDTGVNGSLTYTIASHSPANLLAVNQQSGILYTTSEIDFEMTQVIDATIRAEDGGGLLATATVSITVTDRNDNAPVFSLASINANITLAETHNVDQVIFNFAAEDTDSGCNGAVAYSILFADPDVFYLDPSSGLLYPFNSDSLDFEKFDTATVVVSAADLGGPVTFSATTVLYLQITGVDDERPVIDNYDCPCFITENAAVGSPQSRCPPLSAYDPDSSTITFSIDPTLSSPSVPFQIDGATGVLSAQHPLDREVRDSYEVAIVATDGGGNSSPPEFIMVRVLDVNDEEPVYIEGALSITVPSDLAPGDFVASLSARDNDVGYNSIVTYNFISGTAQTILNTFTLDPLSGLLYTKAQLMSNTYTFTITAQEGTARNQLSVMVTTSGLRNNPPRFRIPVDHRIVPEDLPINSVITVFSASDSDQGNNGEITYSIVNDLSSNHSGLFSLQSNGLLELSQSLSGRAGIIYAVNVSATDAGSPTLASYQLLLVRVYAREYLLDSQRLVYNPSIPVCHYNGTLAESTNTDTLVVQLEPDVDSTVIHYTALNGPDSAVPFSIVSSTLRTRSGFSSTFTDTMAVFITLLAQYGSNFFLCSVTVIIDDINNNPPYFSPASYSFETYVNAPIGASMIRVQAQDNDFTEENSRVSYSINPPNPIPFQINNDTGVISVSQQLSSSTEYIFTVTAVDPSRPTMTASATVRAFVLNTINSAPTFTPDVVRVEYSEILNSSTVPFQLSIADADGNVNRQSINTFCIVSGNLRNAFTVTEQGLLPNHLDYESVSNFNLTVMAYDNSLNPASGTATVLIQIEDENEPPVFSVPIYNASFLEGSSAGSPVITVRTVDRDMGNSGTVRYSVPDDVPFLVNATSGAISSKETITNRDLIVFNVTATDGGSPPRSSIAEVRVFLVDTNNNAPTFSTTNRTVMVPEDVPVGYEILSISELTTDGDSGADGAIRYGILSGNDGAEFSLNPWTGSLRTALKLDYESAPTIYMLAIQASDLGNKIVQTAATPLTVRIRVENANDNFPVFSAVEYHCSIMEQTDTFQTPCQVNATDADNNQLVYSFVKPSTSTFTIESTSGIVNVRPSSIIPSEDLLNCPEYIFQVQANDSLNVAVTILRIKIVDANDIPGRQSIENSTYFIFEDTPVNNLLFFAHFHDMDSTPQFSSVSYGLLAGNDHFSVDEETGAVFLTTELTYDRQASPLQLIVNGANVDVGGASQATYRIHILDAIKNQLGPVFNSDANPVVVWISRSLTPGSDVLIINATDPDEGNSVTYDIVGGTGVGYFQINSATGVIVTLFPLTAVVSSTLTVVVRAVDGSGVQALQSFHEVIFSLSDSVTPGPVFDYPVFCATPSENVAQQFHVVRATIDGMTDSSIVYNISAGNEDNTFTIDSQTGAVSLAPSADLNREIKDLYNITVTASRPGIPGVSSALLVVDVQDADDFRPTFLDDFNFTVFNTFPIGEQQPLVQIFAVDEDIGENRIISYALQNLPSSSPFAISNSTGHIYLTQPLSGTSVDHYDLTVSAKGLSFPSSEVTFSISVLPPWIGNPPIPISVGTIPLNENSPHLSLITQVTLANQPTTPFPVIFRILEQDAKVSILPNTGEVYLTGHLDYEAESSLSYSIQILYSATDNPATIPLVIHIVDLNDNRPQFESSSYTFSISEAQLQPHYPVGVVQATDRDSDAITNLTFSVVDASAGNVFTVDPFTGIITLSANPSSIDRENLPFYSLTISVSDGGSPPLLDFTSVTIIITDTDDNDPVFQPASLNIYVPEDIEVGQVVYTVSAFDPDLGSGASISYELATSSAAPFLLNSTTGDIAVSSSLDTESQETYELQILAFNPNNRSRGGGMLNLTVIVSDILDSGPVLMGPAEAGVRENYPTYSKVAQIQSPYSGRPVYYSIVGGNQLDHFLIESITGTVRTTTHLDRENISSYELIIQGAYAIGYESNFTLNVIVTNVNDEKPMFSSPFMLFEVPENSLPLQPLGNLTKPGQNKRLSFAIVDSFAASVFTINSGGVLELKQNQVLDIASRFSSLTFEVYAITEEAPNQFSRAVIEVDVTDSNDPPQFDQTDYTFVISTPLQAGSPQFRVQAEDTDEGVYGDLTYSLSGPGASGVFSINPITGYVSVVNSSMILPEYHLTLTASDGGGLEASTNLSITFSECNFRNLTFTPSSVRVDVSVLENATTGHVIVRQSELNVLDLSRQDGSMQADVSFSFQLPTPNFDIDSNTGEITVLKLDREAQDTHFLVVQAMDNSDSSRLALALVVVTVLDVNDNSPQFSMLMYSRTITEEDLQLNNFTYNVLPVSATDLDEGTNSEVMYRLTQPSNVFTVDPSTGFITLSTSQELVPVGSTFQLQVEAIDRGNPPQSSVATVTITIVDSRAPRFTQLLYSIEVPENTPSNTAILNVTLDNSLETGPISFRFVGGNLNIPFSISSNGIITVVDPRLDYESQRSYNLTLRARDIENGLDGFATLIVEVQDYNDVTPTFTESNGFYVRTVVENTTIGTVVLHVNATDFDSLPNAQISYSLGANDTDVFVIDQMGRVVLNGHLDYEQTRTYEFNVYAEDSGSPSLTGTAVVRFQIGNLNDNPPVFQQLLYTTSIQETDSAGPTDLFVSASDPDNLDTITYDIVEGPGSEDFTISGNGRLNLVRVNSTLVEYILNVSAFDGMFYGFTTVQVTIEGVNANSPIFNSTSYTASVVEHSNPGVFVAQVFATDDDRGTNGEITYSLDDTRDYFSINSTTGVIRTSTNAPNIDREMTPSITLLVVATDGGSLTSLAQLHVTVEDINDNRPTFNQNMFIGFTPHNTLNSDVLTVQATDRDIGTNAELIFEIENQDFGLPFRINATTGAIYTFVAPQVGTQAHYQFNVTVRDKGSPSLQAISTTLVDITITEGNQSPLAFEESLYMATISENTPFGTTVIPRIAIDDPNDTISCRPLTLTPDNVPFVLVENDKIRSSNGLQSRTYFMFVSTSCVLILPGGGFVENTVTTTVQIQVLPVNDLPSFSSLLYTAMVQERNTMMSVILNVMPTITVMDPDSQDTPDGMIMFRLLNHNDIFSLIPRPEDSAILLLDSPVDFEMVQSYTLRIEAYDQGSPSLTATSFISVQITDADDNPPVFSMEEYVLEVFENRSIGDLIYTAEVTDVDTISTHMYSISGSILSIDETSGEIRLRSQLDREQSNNYTATIIASDASGRTETTLRLVILDSNDNPPIFNQSQYSITIEENYPTATSFFQVSATDEDEGENAVIIYKPGNTFTSNTVSIDNVTGEIFFTRPPNFEDSEQFTLHILATDIFGTWQQLVPIVVTLEDVNDNRPIFSQANYTAQISENRAAGSTVDIDIVDRVEAMDADSGIRGSLSYSLAGPAADLFTIRDGDIESTVMFDRETNASFDLIIVATDMGSPPMSANTTIHIRITDQNDNSPVFPEAFYTINILESTPIDTPIFTVAAMDDDSGANGEIGLYSLSPMFADFYRRDNPNGSVTIYVGAVLDHEDTQRRQYQLTITAFDDGFENGFPSREGSTSLTINVIDVDDNMPMFTMSTYTATIAENASILSTIVKVTAEDRDASDSSQLLYSIRNAGNTPEIGINETTGVLFVANMLDYERMPSYSLEVMVSGGEEGATVDIDVLNINDNPPLFPQSSLTVNISENNQPNTRLISLTATDVDSNDNRISYRIVSGNVGDRFEISLLGNVIVRTTLDREERGFYELTVLAEDNDMPPLSSNITLIVEVIDVNDNAPVGGHQNIYVFTLHGLAPELLLGEVFVNDSDSDAVNSFTYQLLPGSGTDNILIRNDGSISLNTQTPTPGTYSFTVTVSDNDNPPVNTTISAYIRNVTRTTLDSSFTLQLRGTTPQSFVDNKFGSFIDIASNILHTRLNLTEVDLQVISVQESVTFPSDTDLTIAVSQMGELYIEPLLVQHTLHVNRDDLQQAIPGLTVATESADLCSREICHVGTSCLNLHQYSIGEMALGSHSITYLGVSNNHTSACVKPLASLCAERSCSSSSTCFLSRSTKGRYEAECLSNCSSQPCRNGGTCVDQTPGYFCQCSDGYEGRNCELTTATFLSSSYAAFPSLEGYTSGSISFEFNTNTGGNSLLMYNKRFDKDASDYLAVMFDNNQACILVSYNRSERMSCVEPWNSFSNGEWHQVIILYGPTEVKITGLSASFTDEQATTDIIGHSLDVNSPVYIGAVPSSIRDMPTAISDLPGYTGCLRNLLINGEVVDFSSPLLQSDVTAGCTREGCNPSPCKNGAECYGQGECDCSVDFSGPTCDQESRQVTFLGDNFIQYEVINDASQGLRKRQSQAYSSIANVISFSFLTTEPSGAILQIGDPLASEYMVVEISDGYVQVRYDLGGGSRTLRVSSVVVTDAQPRTVLVSRMEGNLEVIVNNTYFNRSSDQANGLNDVTLSVLARELFLGAQVDINTKAVVSGFTGCLKGIKLDRKELPFTESGSAEFKVVEFPPGGPISGCPLLNVREREVPRLYFYVGLGVIIGSILLISFVFIITCAVINALWRKRHGDFNLGNSSRPGSPGQSGFSWQPATELTEQKVERNDEFELHATNHLPGHTRLPSYQSQTGEDEHQFSRSNSTFHKPMQLTSVNVGPIHTRQGSRQSDRSGTVPLPREGFSPVNQENPGYLQSTPQGSDEEDGRKRPQHLRSSSGHFSVQSDDSNKANKSRELRKALDVHKRVELANADLEEIVVDEIKHYNEEGPYEPLGSIGSLYNILLDADGDTRPVNFLTPGLTYEPSAASPTEHTNTALAPNHPPVEQARLPRQKPVDYTTPVRTHGQPTNSTRAPPVQLDARMDKKQLKKQPPPPPQVAPPPSEQGRKPRKSSSKPTSPVKTNPLIKMPPPPGPPPPLRHSPPSDPPPPPPGHQLRREQSTGKTNPLHDIGNSSQYYPQEHHVLPPPEAQTTSKSKPHSKKWEVSIYKEENEEKPSQEQAGPHSRQPQRLRRSERRSGRKVARNRSVENILDKFHNITISGGLSQDSKEVTKVL